MRSMAGKTLVLGVIMWFSSVYGMQQIDSDGEGKGKDVAQSLMQTIKMTQLTVQEQLRVHNHPDFVRVLLIGATGSGKTTLLHALAGERLNVKRIRREVEGGEFSSVVLSIGRGSVIPAQIGHTSDSETYMPNLWSDLSEKIVYCDTPGFLDNRSYECRIVNALSVDQLFSNPCAIKIFLVVSADEFLAGRAEGVNALFSNALSLFDNQEQFEQSVGLVITKGNMEESPIELLGHLFGYEGSTNSPLVDFFLKNPEKVFTFPSQALGRGVQEESYTAFKDRERMIAFAKVHPAINPPHSIALDPESVAMIILTNRSIRTDMMIALNDFAERINRLSESQMASRHLHRWEEIMQQLLSSVNEKGGEGLIASIDRIPQLTGKFDAFKQKISDFLPWQVFVKDLLAKSPKAHEEVKTNVFEMLCPLFDTQLSNISGIKERIELEERIERERLSLIESQRRAERDRERLAAAVRELDREKKEERKRWWRAVADEALDFLGLLFVGALQVGGAYMSESKKYHKK